MIMLFVNSSKIVFFELADVAPIAGRRVIQSDVHAIGRPHQTLAVASSQSSMEQGENFDGSCDTHRQQLFT